MQFLLYDPLHHDLRPLDVNVPSVLQDDTVELCKQILAAQQKISTVRIALFFGDSLTSATSLVDGGSLDEAVDVVKMLSWTPEMLPGESPNLWRRQSNALSKSSADAMLFERQRVLCELHHFSETIIVLVLPELQALPKLDTGAGALKEALRTYWPRWTPTAAAIVPDQAVPVTFKPSQRMKHRALALPRRIAELGDTEERVMMESCVVHWQVEGAIAVRSMIPEYVFEGIELSDCVPFAMCRSLVKSVPPAIRVFRDNLKLKRDWPFKTARCSKLRHVTGILFRVVLQQPSLSRVTFVEWLPDGHFQVLLYDVALELAEQPTRFGARLMREAQDVMHVFLNGGVTLRHVAPYKLPSQDKIAGSLRNVLLTYTVFCAVPDLNRLVDEVFLQQLFLEKKLEGNAEEARGSVSLLYAPLSTRAVGGQDTQSSSSSRVLCTLTRSATNGILFRIRHAPPSTFASASPELAFHALCVARLMITRALPREFRAPRNEMQMQDADPELHLAFRNCAISRKLWNAGDGNVVRRRQCIVINPECEEHVARYNRIPEAERGPIMKYRNVWYAAVLDYEDNSGAKSKVMLGRRGKPRGQYRKSDLFHCFPALREIPDLKHRNPGFDSDDFRYVPFAIKYKDQLPDRQLAIMAPLYRRGLIDFRWSKSADIIRQLREFELRGPKSRYVVTALTTLGPDAHGNLPKGAIADYFDLLAGRLSLSPVLEADDWEDDYDEEDEVFMDCSDDDDNDGKSGRRNDLLFSWKRRGVLKDRDAQFAILHAVCTGLREKEYGACNSIMRKQNCVRRIAKRLMASPFQQRVMLRENVDDPLNVLLDMSSNTAAALLVELFAMVFQVNIMIVNHNLTKDDADIRFAARRFLPYAPTIVLLQMQETFEPIVLVTGRDVLNGKSVFTQQDNPDVMVELHKLFVAFHPKEAQHMRRVTAITDCVDTEQPPEQWVLRTSQQWIALSFNDNEFVFPLIAKEPALDLPTRWLDTEHGFRFSLDLILRSLALLRGHTELWEVYRPSTGLLTQTDMCASIVLGDNRLLLPLETPVLPAQLTSRIMSVLGVQRLNFAKNDSLVNPYLGIPVKGVSENTELHMALTDSDCVKRVFRQILKLVQEEYSGYDEDNTTWIQLPSQERRLIIEKQLVEPVLEKAAAAFRSLNQHLQTIIFGMLISYCDHHPDVTQWFTEEIPFDPAVPVEITQTRARGVTLQFDSPAFYQNWLLNRD